MIARPRASEEAAHPSPAPQRGPNYTPPESPPNSIEWGDRGLPYPGRRAAEKRWKERPERGH